MRSEGLEDSRGGVVVWEEEWVPRNVVTKGEGPYEIGDLRIVGSLKNPDTPVRFKGRDTTLVRQEKELPFLVLTLLS